MRKLMMTTGLIALAIAPVYAQAPVQDRTVTISANGSVARQPDRAVLSVAVESRAATAQAASQANARKMEVVYATLRKMGITPPNVSTTSYALQPEYGQPDPRSGQPQQPRVIGYVAVNTVRVQTDSIIMVGSIIDAVTASGANRIDGIGFELRDPQAARLEALKQAVARAQSEADVVAAAAGQRLGKPLNISTSSGYEPRPMYRMANAEIGMVAAAPPPTPVEAGTLIVNATVNITYKLEDR